MVTRRRPLQKLVNGVFTRGGRDLWNGLLGVLYTREVELHFKLNVKREWLLL